MKTITKIDSVKLASGIQAILLDMAKGKEPDFEPSYPVAESERLICESKGVSKKEAERVTEEVINTGIIRWKIFGNNFVL